MNGPATAGEDALKLTSYFGERRRTPGRGGAGGFAADALLDLYGREQVAASILLRGVEGFGARNHPRTDRSLTLSDDLPLIAVAVDRRSRIEALVEPTARITGTGLVTLERARLLAGETGPVTLREGVHEETKLTVYLGRLRPAPPARHRGGDRAARRGRDHARRP
jgi:PII-like signaling protein